MKKKFFALLSAAVIILSVSSCGGETAASTTAAGASSQVSESMSAWNAIDRNTVVAYVEGAENPAEFNITFGEFYSEYLYDLLSYGIDDDTAAAYAETCASFRDNIISYLKYERIFLHVAKEMGISEENLTEDEKKQVKEAGETTRNNFLSKYINAVQDELGEGASEDALRAREEELLKADLARAELDDSIFYRWELNSFIQNKLLERVMEGIEITDKQVNDMFEEYVGYAKDALATSPLSYESNETYTMVYVPEGTRIIEQILFTFDEDTINSISEARKSGNDEEADRIRNEAYESQLKEKSENLTKLIESGENFYELQSNYSAGSMGVSYSVIKNSNMYVKEFVEAAFSIPEIGGISSAAVSDYGVHFLYYSGDKTVTDEEKNEILSSMRNYLEYQEQTKRQQAAYEEWLERFPYVTDKELLKLPEETEETAE